ncbi:TetR/AcrR family transcriptional regulator C-terminal domain-containing protein [Cellulomonas alba]|uniref:TetR/AcrR family transcriptional regulator C-terminal domain-containing protein n=1 Tax=Cellulomonas alba TaxID=3053467 RepID=A0ABT7SFJ7_9CELL|nr:TetR/AcrR family transcriptional regulator C-terminal domain-containing protein [Cellulomonas alba]MDM7854965.1 TetR/AcrR family transcriptional regulator C-terminal domain-containing protein [Cellulomonas alba]
MTTQAQRERLNRERVLTAAIELADEQGVDALSMRRLADRLGVVPMALYKHVAHKDELLDGLVEHLIAQIDPPAGDVGWREAVRRRVLSARRVLLRHPWARRVLETRTQRTFAVLAYTDSTIGMFRAGGFSDELTHHVMHALGSRMWGFTQELFDDAGATPGAAPAPVPDEATLRALAAAFPNVAAVALPARHDGETVVGSGCDDQAEFEFALDLMLDGFARLHEQGWTRGTAV